MMGQASFESLTLLGFVILFSVPLIMLLTSISSDDAAVEQAKTTVKILSDAVNTVYIQGSGSQKLLLVAYPQRLLNVTLNDTGSGLSEITFTVNTQSGPTDVVGITIAPVNKVESDLLAGRFGAGLQRVLVYYDDVSDTVVLKAVD
ncbi:MAG: hypothetical protein DRP79_09540 [Planctomycetota bacterium]|nr:MAG: hypothetical protein DRP79_09540 [Planctomycetota bacterium]